MKLEKKMMNKQNRWLDLAQELQFLAQGGLAYTKDKFDQERFERIRQISAEMVALQSDLPIAAVTSLFCNETGFQTPKLDFVVLFLKVIRFCWCRNLMDAGQFPVVG